MNNGHESTYTLLVRSEQKGRGIMETVAYAMCILSAIVAIWQFVAQSSQPSVDSATLHADPAPVMSQHALEADLDTGS
jgi:hypothetical protein